MNSYDQGQVVVISSIDPTTALGFNSTVNGILNTPVDPPTVMVVVYPPNKADGTVQSPIRATWTQAGGDPSGVITHVSTGVFTASVDTFAANGEYVYRWYTPDNCAYQSSMQNSFYVNEDLIT